MFIFITLAFFGRKRRERGIFKVSNCWCDVIVDVKGRLNTTCVFKDTFSDDDDAVEDDDDDIANCDGRFELGGIEENYKK